MERSALISRRHFVAGVSLAPLIPLPVLADVRPAKFRRALLGTQIDLVVAQPEQPGTAQAVANAFDAVQRLERQMSRFDSTSTVSQINRLAGQASVEVSAELMAVLQLAQRRARQTAGAFNPVLGQLTTQADPGAAALTPDQRRQWVAHAGIEVLELDTASSRARLHDPLARIDLGGVAKLYIMAAAMEHLNRAGLRGVLLNGGGDVMVSPRADGLPWRIGVRDACQPDQLLCVVPLRAGVVASSGDYERYVVHHDQRVHHIIDPHTGVPTVGLHGVTFVAQQQEEVNAYGPAAMVAGPRAAMRRLREWGVAHALLMHTDGRTEASAALRAKLQPPPTRSDIRGLLA